MSAAGSLPVPVIPARRAQAGSSPPAARRRSTAAGAGGAPWRRAPPAQPRSALPPPAVPPSLHEPRAPGTDSSAWPLPPLRSRARHAATSGLLSPRTASHTSPGLGTPSHVCATSTSASIECHAGVRRIGLRGLDLLALNVRAPEYYLDWSGFGHARGGDWQAVRSPTTRTDASRPGVRRNPSTEQQVSGASNRRR
jgi:hypothetical protein